MRSRPGISLSNFTQWTTRWPGFAGVLGAVGFSGPQDSSTICILHRELGQSVLIHDTARRQEIQTVEDPNVSQWSAGWHAGKVPAQEKDFRTVQRFLARFAYNTGVTRPGQGAQCRKLRRYFGMWAA